VSLLHSTRELQTLSFLFAQLIVPYRQTRPGSAGRPTHLSCNPPLCLVHKERTPGGFSDLRCVLSFFGWYYFNTFKTQKSVIFYRILYL